MVTHDCRCINEDLVLVTHWSSLTALKKEFQVLCILKYVYDIKTVPMVTRMPVMLHT